MLLIVLILFGIAVMLGTLYALYHLISNFQPGDGKLMEDVKVMRQEIQPWISDLVPWTKEEMELLSFNQINKAVKKGFATTVKGIVTSIYNEPMMAYSYKKYISTGERALLLVRTAHHEFVYRIGSKGVDVIIDNQLVGRIRDGRDFLHVKDNRLLARIQRTEGALMLPILVANREVGHLNLPNLADKATARAFPFVTPMSKEEEALFLSLAAFEMIKLELD